MENENEDKNELNYQANAQLENVINNSFFYTNDKFIESLDHELIFQKMYKHCPMLAESTNDNMIIKSLVQILSDEAFIEEILDQYNLTTSDFFKIILGKFCLTFKALQIKKLKAVVQNKSYVNKFRPKYNY